MSGKNRRRAPAVAMPPGQLVLTRRVGEQLLIKLGEVEGTITVAEIRTRSPGVRIALSFPRSVKIVRSELLGEAVQ